MDSLIKRLREAAERATGGEWMWTAEGMDAYPPGDKRWADFFCLGKDDDPIMRFPDEWDIEGPEAEVRDHIALCSPENILALCERIERTEDRLRKILQLAVEQKTNPMVIHSLAMQALSEKTCPPKKCT
jgi:hypothetical protein